MQKKVKITILFSTFVYIFFAFSVYAQVQNADVTLSLNPKYPKANQNVTASISTFSTDLNKSKIAWKLNGQISIEAVGKKTFSFTTASTGLQTVLEVEIQTSDGSFITKRIIITPSDIDMLWEAPDSYVPPFYKGKALNSPEGTIKIVALTDTTNSAGLTYNWKLDGTNKQDSSGYKKNYYIFKNSFLDKNNEVEVTTSNLSGKNTGQGKILITPVNPKIVFYQKDLMFGTKYEKAITDNFNINPNGEVFVVEPYFFSPKNLNSSDLEFNWSLGGSQINTPSPKNELGIAPEKGQTGQSKIKVSINNLKKMFLTAEKEIQVSF